MEAAIDAGGLSSAVRVSPIPNPRPTPNPSPSPNPNQAGFLPLVELPYAAYLSCGYNQFVEACFLHWLSAGRQPNGMVIRMQAKLRGRVRVRVMARVRALVGFAA